MLNTYLKNIIIRGDFLGGGLDDKKTIIKKCYGVTGNMHNRMITKAELNILYEYLKTYKKKKLIINLKK